jgi:hypothetical protein
MVNAAAAADGFIQGRTLHKELVLKTFHAQVGVELKEYELEKLKKKSNSKVVCCNNSLTRRSRLGGLIKE